MIRIGEGLVIAPVRRVKVKPYPKDEYRATITAKKILCVMWKPGLDRISDYVWRVDALNGT